MSFRTARSLGARAVPLAAASALSVTFYIGYHKLHPVRNDDTPYELAHDASHISKQRDAGRMSPAGTPSPFTPLGWGSNANLTLVTNERRAGPIKKPTAMTQLGGTPLRDLVVHEKYGAAIDARGDLWMWGTGYDPTGQIGRSLRGKKLRKLAPGPGKLFGLSKHGRLFVVSADKAFQDGQKPSRNWYRRLTTRDPIVDFVEVKPNAKFQWGEHFTDVSVGSHHLLAVTNHGRTFSLPLSPSANTHRQLGTKQTFPEAAAAGSSVAATIARGPDLPPDLDPRFASTLTEIPALSGVNIAQVATSDRSSFVRTPEGRVLGFGANDFGQIGLGNTTTVSIVPTPVEIVLSKAYANGTGVKCRSIAAGGQTTMFIVDRKDPSTTQSMIDVLSCGNGQYGTLGSGISSSASFAPSRIRALSGLEEYSEKVKGMVPLPIRYISISPSPAAHAFAVLDTLQTADAKGSKESVFGRDVLVWGANAEYQLGTGKRSSVSTPQNLPGLVPHAMDAVVAASLEKSASPIPLSRLQLHITTAPAYDPLGKLIKKRAKCEETVLAGWNCSVLYNKIID